MNGTGKVTDMRICAWAKALIAAVTLGALLVASSLGAPSTAFADDSSYAAGAVGAFEQQDGVAAQEEVTYSPMYRIYNPRSGEHFYTASKEERNHLSSIGWHYEGVGWMAPSDGDPVYRLYNPNAGDHHYTLSEVERDHLVSVGWKSEGTGWLSCSSEDKKAQPLYRQYNPNARAGAHNFTLYQAENDYLVNIGWHAEGYGWLGHDVPADFSDDLAKWTAHISGDADLDTELDFILLDHKTLWSCYEYVTSFGYRSGNRFWSGPRYLSDSTTIGYAKEMINLHAGNCYRFASLLRWLAKGLGYDASVVSGYVPSASGGNAPHGWVEIWQDGKAYICDPDLNHELPGHNWFMVTYANAPTTYGYW